MNYLNFTQDGKEIDKTVIIGPIRIFESYKVDGGIKVYDLVIGCNLFCYYENYNCGYS